MLRLPPFKYLAARSVSDAVRLLADHGPRGTLVAGGTDLYPNMKRRQFEPEVLIGLRGVRELAGVRRTPEGGIIVGSGTTLARLAEQPEIRGEYPALAEAAGLVSSPTLRNMATLGGNVCIDTRCNYYNQGYEWRRAIGFCTKKDGTICLVAPGSPDCWAVASSDTAPVLWALGARVRLVSPRGERLLGLGALYRNDGFQNLTKQPDEILTEIILPPAAGLQAAYLKLRRRGSIDFPVLGVAVALRLEGGVVRSARIVLGAVAPEPREAAAAAAGLVGEPLGPEQIARAAQAAAAVARPLDNTDFSHIYRKRMTSVFVARALRRAAGLPEHGGTPEAP